MNYNYRVFDMIRVIELVDALAKLQGLTDDAYITDDAETRPILNALNTGYRWVRSENGLAIFEKQID